MAYKTEELIKLSIKAIEDNDLVFFDEIILYVACSLSTLYKHGLQESEDIKKALYINRLKKKKGLRAKWYKSDAPATQSMLYKLIADEHEYSRLATVKQENKTVQELTAIKLIEDK